MPANLDTITTVLGSAVTTSGTITLSYPSGRSRADYVYAGVEHRMVWNGNVFRFGKDITIAFNATTVVVTLVATATIPAGASVTVELDRMGGGSHNSFMQQLRDLDVVLGRSKSASVLAPTVLLSMGSPITIDRDGIRASATFTAPGTTLATALALTMDGARVTSGVAYLDVPRNITVYAAGNVSGYTVYVTGTDTNGDPCIEGIASPNATTTQGLKAFATVTSVSIYGSGTPGAIEIGFGKVLGLPVFLSNTAHVLLERENNAAPGGGAGTFVAGVTSTPTATTGSPHGTYTPTATPDGSIAFHLLIAMPTSARGVPQFGQTVYPTP